MKCPICEENNIGKYFIICRDCVARIVKKNLNFSYINIPKEISSIFPSEIIDELTPILIEDITETLQLLRSDFFTPAVLMGSRVFENMMFHYFDEEFYQDYIQDQSEDFEEETEVFQNKIFGFLESVWEYNSWNNIDENLETETEYIDEVEDYPSSLSKLIDSLETLIPEIVITQMKELKNIRNEACHGNKRYSKHKTFMFIRKVLKVVVLVYNGNFGKLPEQK